MTLIIKLSQQFTDTSLPTLRLDPLLTASATPILYDFKSVAGRALNFNSSTPSFRNLGTYTAVSSITPDPTNFPWNATKGAITYDSDTGGLTLALEAAGTQQIFNSTNSFVVILWASRRSSNLGTYNFASYLGKGSGNTSSGNQTLYFVNGGSTPSSTVITRLRLSATDGVAGTAAEITGPATGGAPVQMALHWFYDGTQWKTNCYSNNIKDNEEIVNANPLRVVSNSLGFFVQQGGTGVKGAQVHRLLIENLSLSGRAAADVINLDYVTNNGRFAS